MSALCAGEAITRSPVAIRCRSLLGRLGQSSIAKSLG